MELVINWGEGANNTCIPHMSTSWLQQARNNNNKQDNTTGKSKEIPRAYCQGICVLLLPLFSIYSQANFVSKLLRQIANAWKAESG